MPEEHILSKSNISFAKLTATPTETAWSQVYNAGNLFACLALTSVGNEGLHGLGALGKDLFNNFEAEFFTLEEKNLTTISEAIQKSLKHIGENVKISFCLAHFRDAILYLFIVGEGRVVMKREGEIKVLLEGGKDLERKIQTASGYLQNNDTVILETSQFAKNISESHLSESLKLTLPSDIAEALSLPMHEKADGDQAAIIIAYHGIANPALDKPNEGDENIMLEDMQIEEEKKSSSNLPKLPKLSHFSLPNFHPPSLPYLNHRKKFFLSISVIILILLVVSIFLTKQKQTNSKNIELFNFIYPPALKSYEEGVGLKALNTTLSHEDFLKAEKLLTDGKNKFSENSKEDKQIEELLAKVQAELGSLEQTNVKQVSLSENNILVLEKANSNASGFSQNAGNIYFVTNEVVFAVNKKSGKKTEIIKNNKLWEKAIAIAPFQANLYILDQNDGILKFVPSGNSYNKSNYLKTETDLSSAKAMTIDSAIFVLFSDGFIKKYLRGGEEKFIVKNLDKPFANPAKIFTDEDTESIYVLDNGNGRVVKLGKDGYFQKQYSAGVIKQAKDFEVLEKDRKINILAGDKFYQLEID